MKQVINLEIIWKCPKCGYKNYDYIEDIETSKNYISPEDYEFYTIECEKCHEVFYIKDIIEYDINFD